MAFVELNIIEPENNQPFEESPTVRFTGEVVEMPSEVEGVTLYYRWYSSLYEPKLNENNKPDYFSIERNVQLRPDETFFWEPGLGSHAITFAVTDRAGETLEELQAVCHTGVTGGSQDEGQCLIHVFKAKLLSPEGGLLNPVQRDNLFLIAEAPLGWAKLKLGSSLFSVGDLKDSASLAVKLRDASDPLSLFLQEQFSSTSHDLLTEYDSSSAPSELLQEALIDELNELLQGPSLYDETRFAHVTLSQETQQLIAQNPEGKYLIRLNRWLLEEAYLHEIAKTSKYELNLDYHAYNRLRYRWEFIPKGSGGVRETLVYLPSPEELSFGCYSTVNGDIEPTSIEDVMVVYYKPDYPNSMVGEYTLKLHVEDKNTLEAIGHHEAFVDVTIQE